jgi:heat shock protein HslJ
VLARVPGTGEPTSAANPAAAVKVPALAGTSWVVDDIGGTGVLEGAHATLEFPQADRAVGSGSCNRFSGGVTIGDSTIAFRQMISTKIACAPAVMAQEGKYLQALQGAERYALDGASLTIYAKGLDKPLRFSRAAR